MNVTGVFHEDHFDHKKEGIFMKKVILMCMVVLLAGAVGAEAQKKGFPTKDITNIVVWSAGGGTDVCNRIISAEMSKILGVNINVINKTGGVGGSIGMADAYSKPHDGYTLCGLSESCVTAGVQGGWDKRMNVWDFFIVGGSPDLVSVTPSTPYKTLKDLIEAAKKDPGAVKSGASASGSIHHLNLLALEKGSGAKLNFIPYPGSAPAQNAAMTGEVQVVITSLAEQQALIRGGKLRPLAMLIPTEFEVADVGKIPSAFDDYPALKDYLPISQAIGFAVPAAVPQEVKSAIENAFKKAMDSEAMQKFGKENYYLLSGKTGAEAKKEFDQLESLFAWTLWELGAAKVDPATLNIPKPAK
jgi:tripartite-type tricarboxylate transporter receptor subunit TctC